MMKNRTLALLLSILAIFGLAVSLTAPSASAATTKKSFGCTISRDPALHMTATRSTYNSTQTSIYASATQSHFQVLDNAPDINWKFLSFTSSSGLQTRDYQPTTWGGSTGNRLLNTVEYITVNYRGLNSAGGDYYTSCTTRVGT